MRPLCATSIGRIRCSYRPPGETRRASYTKSARSTQLTRTPRTQPIWNNELEKSDSSFIARGRSQAPAPCSRPCRNLPTLDPGSTATPCRTFIFPDSLSTNHPTTSSRPPCTSNSAITSGKKPARTPAAKATMELLPGIPEGNYHTAEGATKKWLFASFYLTLVCDQAKPFVNCSACCTGVPVLNFRHISSNYSNFD